MDAPQTVTTARARHRQLQYYSASSHLPSTHPFIHSFIPLKLISSLLLSTPHQHLISLCTGDHHCSCRHICSVIRPFQVECPYRDYEAVGPVSDAGEVEVRISEHDHPNYNYTFHHDFILPSSRGEAPPKKSRKCVLFPTTTPTPLYATFV